MKKKIVFIIIIISVCAIFPLQVYANGPVPPRKIVCEVLNPPDNTVYTDLLIHISEKDSEYTPFNAATGQRLHISEHSEIVSYNSGGFQSFTFHFADAASEGGIDESAGAVQFGHEDDQFQTLLEKYHIIKIALLDIDGNIVKISDSVDINPNKPGFFMGHITYDAANNTVDAPYYNSPFAIFVYIFTGISVLIRMCISSSVETLIAIPFKLRPVRKVFTVNIITQTLLVIFMSLCALPYVWCLLIAEAAVYIAEFNILSHVYKGISICKLAIFVTAANTISLILGLLLNSYNIIA